MQIAHAPTDQMTISSPRPSQGSLLDKIIELDLQCKKLNKKIDRGDDRANLLERLKEVQASWQEVVDQQQAEVDEKTTWGLSASTWNVAGWCMVASSTLAQICQSAVNIPLMFTEDTANSNCTTPVGATISVLSFSTAGIVASVFMGIIAIGQERMNRKTDESQTKINQQAMLIQFFKAYEGYIRPETKKSNHQEEELVKCVALLKEISEQVVSSTSKDAILSALINELPDDNELKIKLQKQYQLAMQLEPETIEMNASAKKRRDNSSLLNTKQADRGSLNTTAYTQNFEALQQEIETKLGVKPTAFKCEGLYFDGALQVSRARLRKQEDKPQDVIVDFS